MDNATGKEPLRLDKKEFMEKKRDREKAQRRMAKVLANALEHQGEEQKVVTTTPATEQPAVATLKADNDEEVDEDRESSPSTYATQSDGPQPGDDDHPRTWRLQEFLADTEIKETLKPHLWGHVGNPVQHENIVELALMTFEKKPSVEELVARLREIQREGKTRVKITDWLARRWKLHKHDPYYYVETWVGQWFEHVSALRHHDYTTYDKDNVDWQSDNDGQVNLMKENPFNKAQIYQAGYTIDLDNGGLKADRPQNREQALEWVILGMEGHEDITIRSVQQKISLLETELRESPKKCTVWLEKNKNWSPDLSFFTDLSRKHFGTVSLPSKWGKSMVKELRRQQGGLESDLKEAQKRAKDRRLAEANGTFQSSTEAPFAKPGLPASATQSTTESERTLSAHKGPSTSRQKGAQTPDGGAINPVSRQMAGRHPVNMGWPMVDDPAFVSLKPADSVEVVDLAATTEQAPASEQSTPTKHTLDDKPMSNSKRRKMEAAKQKISTVPIDTLTQEDFDIIEAERYSALRMLAIKDRNIKAQKAQAVKWKNKATELEKRLAEVTIDRDNKDGLYKYLEVTMETALKRLKQANAATPATYTSEQTVVDLANDNYKALEETYGWRTKQIPDTAAALRVALRKQQAPFGPFKQPPIDIKNEHGDANSQASDGPTVPAPAEEDLQPMNEA
jgi:hypothetical protein